MTARAKGPMTDVGGLIGRERESRVLAQMLDGATRGEGELLLVGGEAGIGKTRLVEDALAAGGLRRLAAAATQGAGAPYEQIVAVFRSYLRQVPSGLADCGPLAPHLAALLPELGTPPAGLDRATLFEAISCAFRTIGRTGPAAVFLDDLHWADATTLELLPAVTAALDSEPLLLVAAYRSDEIPRGHPLRRLRADLRRAGRLHELILEPLDAAETKALSARGLGGEPTPQLARTIYARTQGIPFFVEELTSALAAGGRLTVEKGRVALIGERDLPTPDSVRDAVLLRAAALGTPARQGLEVAAVIGVQFNLELVAAIAGEESLEEAIESGFVTETDPASASFRHALAREALYQAIPWTRRRALHREVAPRLEASGAPPALVAEHWLAAHEPERARAAMVAAAESSWAVHAYRDAAELARRALELWPENTEEAERVRVLERLGECAELSGDLQEAARAWREALDAHDLAADPVRLAALHRRLAGVYELECVWEAAFAEREAAAAGYGAAGLPAEAAVDRLAAAANLQAGGTLRPALELVAIAEREAEAAGRLDLRARALGLKGLILARLGDATAGLETGRRGLSIALAGNHLGAAAEVHDRLGLILENASDYPAALRAWQEGYDFCEAHGISDKAYVCLACLAYVMRKTGDWDQAIAISRGLASADAAPRSSRCAGLGQLGVIHVLRGNSKRARPLLAESFALARRIAFLIIEIDSTWGLARADALEGAEASAAERCRLLIGLAEGSDDLHCPVPALRWATTFFARAGRGDAVGKCVDLLARSASTGSGEALAALAHGLGELAYLSGDPEQAAEKFAQALELLRTLDLPLDRAETQVRAAAAFAAAGERELAVERLVDAYHTARKLKARPLATAAAADLAALGERVDRRLGRRAAAELEQGGLSRREVEVIRLAAGGLTNREIARDLFLSKRTVDMHMRNVLAKLGCRSRTDAARVAAELGLLP